MDILDNRKKNPNNSFYILWCHTKLKSGAPHSAEEVNTTVSSFCLKYMALNVR